MWKIQIDNSFLANASYSLINRTCRILLAMIRHFQRKNLKIDRLTKKQIEKMTNMRELKCTYFVHHPFRYLLPLSVILFNVT